MMKKVLVTSALLCWVPFIALKGYWLHLISTVPGAEHGEVSGPILWFLRALLIFASIMSVLIGVAAVFVASKPTPQTK